MSDINLKKLAKKFPIEDIEWRVQQCGQDKNGNPWAKISAYITNRAIMQRLDDVVGAGFWEDDYKATPCNTGYQCGISVWVGDRKITKWDGAEFKGAGSIDKVKSTFSNAEKRAGVKWGIGRYLYQIGEVFAVCEYCDYQNKVKSGFTFQRGKYKKDSKEVKFSFQFKVPALPEWVYPITPTTINKLKTLFATVNNKDELRFAWENAYKLANSENDDEIMATLTKAKDEAKTRLEDQAQLDNNANLEKLKYTVNNQINIIKAANNESAVNGLTVIAIAEVKSISSGNPLKEAIASVKDAAINQVNKLRG